MKDVFGRDVKIGDKIAAGMNYNRSSVLRIGEVVKVTERDDPYRPGRKWTVRVRWTHNGDTNPERYGWNRDVKESNILGDEAYTYAKFVILPDEFVGQFPPDVKDI